LSSPGGEDADAAAGGTTDEGPVHGPLQVGRNWYLFTFTLFYLERKIKLQASFNMK